MHGTFGWDTPQILDAVFKAYDIRGTVPEEIDARFAHSLGMAAGTQAREQGARSIVVGRDGRLSSVELAAALQAGLRSAGMHVIDIGMATTPMVYFATRLMDTGAGIAVTGSHNPPAHNGFKIVLDGASLYGEGITALRDAMRLPIESASASGGRTQMQIMPCYTARLMGDIRMARPMKIAIDCGNGVAGAAAPALFRALGCEVVELFCEVDGSFPGHHPDPADPQNLQDLIYCLRYSDCEVGLAFDGDGDRLGVVTKTGQIIWPDRQLILFARDVLSRNPGAEILYDVKCSRHVARAITEAGGKATMWKTGHSLIKAKMRETGALLAGEMSGHIFFKERWYGFDDGIYAAARLLEILSGAPDPSALLESLPQSCATPEIKLETAEGEQFDLVEALRAQGQFPGAQSINDLDGIRVDYADGFGLARPSNTTPTVVLRFEGDTVAALARIEEDFRNAFRRIAPHVRLPF
ncbi:MULTISPECIES: phosphomannomutase/phosphoglucomutase [Achromobacter]|jgi:phosphomannomutase/phosphoglucomutase|uniref:Phosphomannomutase/phosphoglucomutase n=1 Tax=Achromobacter aegrifaciens TaxID=1287736 RepID=A0AAD2KJU1_ACHAE|nr:MULTISPECIES: phosphomannomutase/phosphoglucomutase [Achromobacter]PTN50989.1 phosphomannomutase/phosphoglucomutase [Achromobacter xylosoxidans]MBD9384717.1 phosphomannomutase/phosphoglucomutase [Achromobacter sp. ACM02]MBD9423513.1 phosphomannomutase/phosphoglucomutase [Achromobacter sp. ACM04]MBD9432911.1 phosphomannomutase/phosphoglucomutase [Achromobacter sp. ACM03]MBD9476417.1 phosphomannomutase/phosphoglucomutase [Achromobacter sp. ACM01]